VGPTAHAHGLITSRNGDVAHAALLRPRRRDDGCAGAALIDQRVVRTEHLASVGSLPDPQGGGPRAQARVDQVLTVLVLAIRKGRRFVDQLARDRM
jgi:hypothetical protein